MKMLEKLMMNKKAEGPLNENYKNAKMSMLQSLRDHMSGMMKDDLTGAKGMKKVEVAGDSPEAVSEGLDKAKDMMSGEVSEGAEDEAPGSDEAQMEDAVETADSPEKIDMMMEMLKKKKMEMEGSNV